MAPQQTPPPISMLAELTHRCPLQCLYCSNPLELRKKDTELGTADWESVFAQAAELGVLQLHMSGGEPASRTDLEQLMAAASGAGLYTNLITSGLGLPEKRLLKLVDKGLDHVQLSFQGGDEASSEKVGGLAGAFDRKMAFADLVASRGIPLTVNFILSADSIGALGPMIEFAAGIGAGRVEVATVQFHGWARVNKDFLLLDADQVEAATRTVAEARERHRNVMVIDYVPADFFAKYPKACMGGWGQTGLVVDPAGFVLPCHEARSIPELEFDNVKEASLAEIWTGGSAFERFRGVDWMPEPCKSCERKAVDYGGCRCQAMALIGDASATDPACQKSPHHERVLEMRSKQGGASAPRYRNYRNIESALRQ